MPVRLLRHARRSANLMRRAIAPVVLIIAMGVLPLCGWEKDVHYGLTKWLALKAGFDPDEAERISVGTQEPDEGLFLAAPFTVAAYTCLGREEGASKTIQQFHFPSYGHVPGTPQERTVFPGEYKVANGGNELVRAQLALAKGVGNRPVYERARALEQFGLSLHPLEDSWSHQGEPDIPSLCSKRLSWGHPEKRGGCWSHDADVTFLNPKDVIETAHNVYLFMVDYLKIYRPSGASRAVPWTQLEAKVLEFAEARTKQEKQRWFEREAPGVFVNYDFLGGTSLAQGGLNRTGDSWAQLPERLLTVAQVQPAAPRSPRRVLDTFLDLWIVKRDIDGAMQLVDVPSITRLWAEAKHGNSPNPAMWVKTVLGMWLLEDHGFANTLGHGMPNRKGFEQLSAASTNKESSRLIKAEKLAEAIFTPGPSLPEPYLAVLTPRSDDSMTPPNSRYTALFQFRHAPHDALMVAVGESGDHWAVVALDWVVP